MIRMHAVVTQYTIVVLSVYLGVYSTERPTHGIATNIPSPISKKPVPYDG
jgi:hypothetical protein